MPDSHGRAPAGCQPWTREQVRVAASWPAGRDLPVSVALSPAADRLALAVGQQLSICAPRRAESPYLQVACALSPAVAWSANGGMLAYRGEDGTGRVLDLSAAVPVTDEPSLGVATAMAFAPQGGLLARLAPSLAGKMTLTLLELSGDVIWECVLARDRISGNRPEGVNLAWSPDGRILACTTGTSAVWLIDAATGQLDGQHDGHGQLVTGLSWIDSERVVSASLDATMRVWQPGGAVPSAVVETIPAAGMTYVPGQRTALLWSATGELFAWSLDGTPAQLWFRDPPVLSVAAHFTRLAVSAADGLLALVDPGATDLVLVSDWDRTDGVPAASATYANAKVLVLGDSGVGKSGLAMVLAGQEFQRTESTHGRHVWRLPADEEAAASGADREVLLWDLAGQPGYRIVHQLHLYGAALALVLFDSRSETTPLAGVQHWARALRHAHPAAGGGLTTFLVAARADRGGVTVSAERIRHVMVEFALDELFETSAKEGTGADQLRAAMLAAIDWDRIPTITSTVLFAAVKRFVMDCKATGSLLIPVDELCRAFQATVPGGLKLLQSEHRDATAGTPGYSGLTKVFEGCVQRLEDAGLVKRLRFGDFVLFQPELLDAYASAIVLAARNEPDGLGSILESTVADVGFSIPAAERVAAERTERLLVVATLEELIQHELVLREPTEDGMQLVFPSAYRRDLPESEAPRGDGVVFRFEGPVDNVFATLIVRLSRSDRFIRLETWQSAARFAADAGECIVYLTSEAEGQAELRIGYDGVPSLLRMQFERFVHDHLNRHATAGTVSRERLFSCPDDGTAFTEQMVRLVRDRGRDSILCPVCEQRVSLRDEYRPTEDMDSATAQMDASADAWRDRAAATTVLRGKEEVAEFDVYLCHNWDDKPAVRDLAERLRERGLRPWLDEDELRPGMPWHRVMEEQIQHIGAVAVIVGSAVGPWQDQELSAFLRQFAQRECAVIPVLLPGAERPRLPVFLQAYTWVDLGVTDPDPLDRLEWGITGRQPDR